MELTQQLLVLKNRRNTLNGLRDEIYTHIYMYMTSTLRCTLFTQWKCPVLYVAMAETRWVSKQTSVNRRAVAASTLCDVGWSYLTLTLSARGLLE
jgi:hypothetical protein